MNHGYRIDYSKVDVVDLMQQVRERARRQTRQSPESPDTEEARRQRGLRRWLDLDEQRPYELQQTLGLEGDWNVTPEDLRTSHPNLAGRVISALRRLARPLLKLVVNLDLPLYKQFKINLGIAAALDELQRDNAELRRRLRALEARLDGARSDGVRPTDDVGPEPDPSGSGTP